MELIAIALVVIWVAVRNRRIDRLADRLDESERALTGRIRELEQELVALRGDSPAAERPLDIVPANAEPEINVPALPPVAEHAAHVATPSVDDDDAPYIAASLPDVAPPHEAEPAPSPTQAPRPEAPPVPEPMAAAVPLPAALPREVTSAPERAPREAVSPTYPTPTPASGAARGPGLEQRLATRLPIWIGAVALALSGIFLVQYTIEQGWLGETVRVTLGVAFGALLVGLAEFLRSRSASIASGLAAAGVAVLLASFLAATELYALIPPEAGFTLMGLAAAAGVGLSLKHGPIVAWVGLVGGFLTPRLIEFPDAVGALPIFAYVLLLQLALLSVTRRRGWLWLAVGTLAAGAIWVFVWLLGPFASDDALVLGLYVLGSAAAAVSAATFRVAGSDWQDRERWLITMAASATGLVLLALLLLGTEFAAQQWAFLAILCAALLWLARRDEAYLPVAAGAAILVAMLVESSPYNDVAAGQFRFLATASAFAVLFGGAAFAGLWRSARPVMWAALATGAPIAIGTAAYLAGIDALPDAPWGILSLAFAAALVAATAWTAPRRARLVSGDTVLAILASGATAFIAAAVPLELERQWLAVAWSLQAAAVAWIAGRLGVPRLRWLVTPLALLVAVRLLVNPAVLSYPIGPLPLFNWLGYGYGIPAVSLAAAAWRTRRDGDTALANLLEGVAMAIGAVWITLEIHHAFHPEQLMVGPSTLLEWGCLVIGWLLFALALEAASRRAPGTTLARGAIAMALVAMAGALVGPGLLVNPLFTNEPVDGPMLVNALLVAYALPGALMFWLAQRMRGQIPGIARLVDGLEGGAIALGAGWVGLEIHDAFHPPTASATTLLEWGCLVVGWLVYALLLEAAGRRLPATRLALGARVMGVLAAAEAVIFPLLLANPLLTGGYVGTQPLANALLVGYALPAALMVWLARRLRGAPGAGVGARRVAELEVVGIALGAAWLGLEIHRAFHPHPDTLLAQDVPLLEWGCLITAWLLFALVLEAAGRRAPRTMLAPGAYAMAVTATLAALSGPLAVANPLLATEYVGAAPLANALLVAYGIPGALTLYLAYRLRAGSAGGVAWWYGLGSFGLFLVFANINLEVRHAFQGPFLDSGAATATERSAYSIAWVVFATVLLVAGIAWRGRLARFASLAVMLLAVGKVFLIDMGDLRGLYRVFSFLGLGISLFVIAYLYQRFVFRETGGPTAEQEPEPEPAEPMLPEAPEVEP